MIKVKKVMTGIYDVDYVIIKYLDDKSLHQFQQVNHYLYTLLPDSFWIKRCQTTFTYFILEDKWSNVSWKQWYYMHKLFIHKQYWRQLIVEFFEKEFQYQLSALDYEKIFHTLEKERRTIQKTKKEIYVLELEDGNLKLTLGQSTRLYNQLLK